MGGGDPYAPKRSADQALLGTVTGPTFEQPPDGSVNAILDWAKDDPNRLRAALGVEKQKKSPRKSLISRVEKRLGVS